MAPTNLPEMRARLRRDLRDEDAASERWSDDALDRHIGRALEELSLAAPLEVTAMLQTTAESRDLDVSALTGRVAIDAVEYPTGRFPASYARFSVWGDTLTLLVEGAPGAAEDVRLFYSKQHSLDQATTTVPEALQTLLATGAAAYAALEQASFATNRVNLGGPDVWERYDAWGREQLALFTEGLARQGRERRVRARRLYVPADGALGERPLGE
jgi:hypothetical protein